MKAKKQKEDLSHAWLTWSLAGYGIIIYTLFVPSYPTPIGLVWGDRQGGDKIKFFVHGSHVPVMFRRNGVRTKINQEIFAQNQAEVIYSGSCTKEGKAFMRATGYVYDKASDWWILVKPRTAK